MGDFLEGEIVIFFYHVIFFSIHEVGESLHEKENYPFFFFYDIFSISGVGSWASSP